jgi:hypothetical protein
VQLHLHPLQLLDQKPIDEQFPPRSDIHALFHRLSPAYYNSATEERVLGDIPKPSYASSRHSHHISSLRMILLEISDGCKNGHRLNIRDHKKILIGLGGYRRTEKAENRFTDFPPLLIPSPPRCDLLYTWFR